MTNREFYTAVSKNEITADVMAFAADAITKMNKRNESRSSKPSKTQLANEPIKAAILDYLGGRTSALAADIAAACGISTQKASSLCNLLRDEGKVKSVEVKVPKVGKRVSYSVKID